MKEWSENTRFKITNGVKAYWDKNNLQKLEDWKQGKIEVTFYTAKTLLILELGQKCSSCGWSERNVYSDTIPVEADHVDGNRKNNKYTNVRLLCPNCHSLTETYRGLNRKKSNRPPNY